PQRPRVPRRLAVDHEGGGRGEGRAAAPVERGRVLPEGDEAGRAGWDAVLRAARRLRRADRVVRGGQPAAVEAPAGRAEQRPEHAPRVGQVAGEVRLPQALSLGYVV